MILRPLKAKDALGMIEWMHDPDVVEFMQTDFSQKTIDDCYSFISQANQSAENKHFAITDQEDTYLGTVSLKHIQEGTAALAITIRRKAMGTGCAAQAMEEIIRYGIEKLHLKTVYWCAKPENIRAIRFYEKKVIEGMSLPNTQSIPRKKKPNIFGMFLMKQT